MMWLPLIRAASTMARDTPPRPMNCASASRASVKGLRRLWCRRLFRITRSRTGSVARSSGVSARLSSAASR
ncbi:hypothetical protein D9M68_610510 [compost metagenome]